MLCRHVSDSVPVKWVPNWIRRPNGQVPSSLEKRQRSGWVTSLGPAEKKNSDATPSPEDELLMIRKNSPENEQMEPTLR